MRDITDQDWEKWDRNKDVFNSIEEMITYSDKIEEEVRAYRDEVVNKLYRDLREKYPEFTIENLGEYFSKSLMDTLTLDGIIRENPEGHKLWILKDYRTIARIRWEGFKPLGWENYIDDIGMSDTVLWILCGCQMPRRLRH